MAEAILLEIDRAIPVDERVVSVNESAQVAIMGLMLYSVPRVFAESVGALATVPGLGETWRITQTIRAWEKHFYAGHLLIAGQNRNERMFTALTLENLRNHPFGLNRLDGVHSQIYAANTKVQAEWIMGKVRELGIKSLALFAPPYHLLRVYATILSAFKRFESPRIPMIPVPLVVPPDKPTPEYGETAWEMATGEVNRIVEYQKKGDVATLIELREYLSWLWTHTFLPSVEKCL